MKFMDILEFKKEGHIREINRQILKPKGIILVTSDDNTIDVYCFLYGNYMDIEIFVKCGMLQEVNRRYLHPRGMALTVEIDDAGNYKIIGIQVADDQGEIEKLLRRK